MSIMNTVAVVGADAPPKAVQVGGLDSSGNIAPFSIDADGKLEIAGTFSADPPVGAATEAKQDTIIGHIDGVETLLGTIDADTSALAGAVDGTEVQVDVVAALPAGDNNIGNVDIASALPAGTNAIGKLAANSGVDIGDVDVTSIAAGENHLGEVGGNMVRVSAEVTRPANTTAYTAGDVVSESESASTLLVLTNAVRVNAGSGYIVSARLNTDKKSITPRFRVHLYNASDPTRSVDNLAHQDKYADSAKRLGYFDLPAMTTATDTTNSDMSRSQDNALRHPIVAAAATRTIYALLETLDAFTPASGEKFTLTLAVDSN